MSKLTGWLKKKKPKPAVVEVTPLAEPMPEPSPPIPAASGADPVGDLLAAPVGSVGGDLAAHPANRRPAIVLHRASVAVRFDAPCGKIHRCANGFGSSICSREAGHEGECANE